MIDYSKAIVKWLLLHRHEFNFTQPKPNDMMEALLDFKIMMKGCNEEEQKNIICFSSLSETEQEEVVHFVYKRINGL